MQMMQGNSGSSIPTIIHYYTLFQVSILRAFKFEMSIAAATFTVCICAWVQCTMYSYHSESFDHFSCISIATHPRNMIYSNTANTFSIHNSHWLLCAPICFNLIHIYIRERQSRCKEKKTFKPSVPSSHS